MTGTRPRRSAMALTPDLVARCHRVEPDPGPHPDYVYLDDAAKGRLADALLGARPAGPFWVFAYGSLIWSPGFEVAEHRRGVATGWHRAFCIEMRRWRGTPERPGLMMALARGGRCVGVLLRLPEAEAGDIVHRLVRREISIVEDLAMVRWTRVAAAGGTVPALVFWAGATGPGISLGLPLDTVARRLAHACGHGGSCAEYLYQTVVNLEAHGIRDRNLWRLQRLVAAEIQSWGSPGPEIA